MRKACTFLFLLCALAALTPSYAYKDKKHHHSISDNGNSAAHHLHDNLMENEFGPFERHHYKRHADADAEHASVSAPKVHKEEHQSKKKKHPKVLSAAQHVKAQNQPTSKSKHHHAASKRHAKTELAEQHQKMRPSHNKQHKPAAKSPKHHQNKPSRASKQHHEAKRWKQHKH